MTGCLICQAPLPDHEAQEIYVPLPDGAAYEGRVALCFACREAPAADFVEAVKKVWRSELN